MLLANTILSGEGTGSLLFKELRVRDGYVYSVDSKFDIEEDGATFSISYASDPKDVDRAQAAALAILRRLQSVPLDDVELNVPRHCSQRDSSCRWTATMASLKTF